MKTKYDIYLDTCLNEIQRIFGQNEGVTKDSYNGALNINFVAPEDGSSTWCYRHDQLEWIDTGQTPTNWHISADGEVEVSYAEDIDVDNYLFMPFNLGHPHEPAELLHLLTQPKGYWQSMANNYEARSLGDLVTFHLLFPSVRPWRGTPVESVIASNNQELLSDVYGNLIDDHSAAMEGRLAYGAEQFRAKWQQWTEGCEKADNLLAEGYVMGRGSRLRWAASLPHPWGDAALLTLRMNDGVSSLFMREYMNHDVAVERQVVDAYLHSADLSELIDALKQVEIKIPEIFTDQIRIAAEVNSTRTALINRGRWMTGAKSFAGAATQYTERLGKVHEFISSLTTETSDATENDP